MTHLAPAPRPYDPDATTRAYDCVLTRGRIRSDEIWSAARQLYAMGATGAEVRERYGLGRSAFYNRARKEGWRRNDELESPPLRDEYDRQPEQLERDAVALALEAWEGVCRAMDRGRTLEARSWMRLYRELREVAVARMEDAMLHLSPADAEKAGLTILHPALDDAQVDQMDSMNPFPESIVSGPQPFPAAVASPISDASRQPE